MSTENKIRVAWLVLGMIAVVNYVLVTNRSKLEVVTCDQAICQVYDPAAQTVHWVGLGVEGLHSDPYELQNKMRSAR
jgi:hypothetical protein